MSRSDFLVTQRSDLPKVTQLSHGEAKNLSVQYSGSISISEAVPCTQILLKMQTWPVC